MMDNALAPAYRRPMVPGSRVDGTPRAAGMLPSGGPPLGPVEPGIVISVNIDVIKAVGDLFRSGTAPDDSVERLYDVVRAEMLKRGKNV
ncbi:MAG: hypothetical protein ACREB9_00695 [Thermoplasmata archaeon]